MDCSDLDLDVVSRARARTLPRLRGSCPLPSPPLPLGFATFGTATAAPPPLRVLHHAGLVAGTPLRFVLRSARHSLRPSAAAPALWPPSRRHVTALHYGPPSAPYGAWPPSALLFALARRSACASLWGVPAHCCRSGAVPSSGAIPRALANVASPTRSGHRTARASHSSALAARPRDSRTLRAPPLVASAEPLFRRQRALRILFTYIYTYTLMTRTTYQRR